MAGRTVTPSRTRAEKEVRYHRRDHLGRHHVVVPWDHRQPRAADGGGPSPARS
jgi:hypothetical protein